MAVEGGRTPAPEPIGRVHLALTDDGIVTIEMADTDARNALTAPFVEDFLNAVERV